MTAEIASLKLACELSKSGMLYRDLVNFTPEDLKQLLEILERNFVEARNAS